MDRGDRPEIDLKVHPASTRVHPGTLLTFEWRVKGASRIFLVASPPGFRRHAGLDWVGLKAKGRELTASGELRVTPRSSVVYTFAAQGAVGRQLRSVHVDVVTPCRERPPTNWCQEWERLPPDARRRFEQGARRWAACFGRDASVSLSAGDRVIFTDQATALEWDIRCSDCARMSESGTSVTLVADAAQDAGTRLAWEVGWASEPAACSLEMSGRRIVSDLSPGQYRWTIAADPIWGSSASASAHVAAIPHPDIAGADAERTSDIEGALKVIARDLLNGCIRDTLALDADVPAFRDGWLNRFDVWARVLAEIENANLLTFQCEDVPEYSVDAPPGNWLNGSNTIHLRWTPDAGPNLRYVMLHELIHKAGFNDGLIDHYSGPEIEEQTHQVTAACD